MELIFIAQYRHDFAFLRFYSGLASTVVQLVMTDIRHHREFKERGCVAFPRGTPPVILEFLLRAAVLAYAFTYRPHWCFDYATFISLGA